MVVEYYNGLMYVYFFHVSMPHFLSQSALINEWP